MIEICSLGSSWQSIMIGLGNYMAPHTLYMGHEG